jgi:predicted nucleic acid-binding protein
MLFELADTSAWTTRRRDAIVAAAFDEAVIAGDIGTCSMVEMELLWTARTPSHFRDIRQQLAALPSVSIDERVWARAIDVWEKLAERGRHRQARQADLLIAAAAELAGVGVCHYDRDFEVIASITGQPVRAIAPLGSL